eukprot:68726_1
MNINRMAESSGSFESTTDHSSFNTCITSETLVSLKPSTTSSTTNQIINSDCLCLCDWDDTLMRTTYLLSSIEYEFDEITRKFNEFILYRDKKTLISHFQQVCNRTFELLNTMLIHFKSSNIKIITNGQKGWLFDEK